MTDELDNSKRKDFGKRLRIALAKTDIKQRDIVDTLQCSRQFVSLVVNGMATFTIKQWGKVYEMLQDADLPDYDLNLLNRLLYEARGKIDLDELNIVPSSSDPLKQMIIEGLNDLTQKQLKTVHHTIEQMRINNLDMMANNAGVSDAPGEYHSRPQ